MSWLNAFGIQLSLFFFILWLIGSAAKECVLPEMDLQALNWNGYKVINNAKREDNSKAKTAYNRFASVNDTCSALWEKSAKKCADCAVENCRSSADVRCPSRLPSKPPSCEDLKVNASKACLYYANDRSGACSDLTSKACESHVKNSCVKRAREVCPLTTTHQPLSEPKCWQIKNSPTHYCMFYASLCQGCQTRTECATCTINKCSEKYFTKCPISKPEAEPSCDNIIENPDYSCNYYNDPSHCGSCTNLSRSAECKQCVDKHCQSRVKEVCRFYERWFRSKLWDVSAHTKDPPALIVEEIMVKVAEMAIEEYLELGPVGALLMEGVSQLLHLPGSDKGIFQLIGHLIAFVPWKDEVAGVKCYFTKVIPEFSEEIQFIGNMIYEGVEVTIEHAVKAVSNFFKHVTHFLGRRRKRMITAEEYVPEPTCEEIRLDPVSACSFYKKHGYCWNCDFNPAADCPGWESAVQDLKSVQSVQHWLATATSNRYHVLSVKPAEDRNGCEKVKVKVHLFGREYTVFVYLEDDVKELGVRIAEAAVEEARQIDVTTV